MFRTQSLAAAATLGFLVLPCAAWAADGNTSVTGTVGTELAVVPAPSGTNIQLTRSGPNESASTIDVTALGAWTLKACESGGDGAMSRTFPTAYALVSPLRIKFRSGPFVNVGSDCNAAGAPTTTGSGVEAAIPLVYRQPLVDADTDKLATGDSFGITVTYRLLNS